MEETLFYVVYCNDCLWISVVEHIDEEHPKCPACRFSDVKVKKVTQFIFNDFSEEACLKIHDALTSRRAKPLADEMRVKIRLQAEKNFEEAAKNPNSVAAVVKEKL